MFVFDPSLIILDLDKKKLIAKLHSELFTLIRRMAITLSSFVRNQAVVGESGKRNLVYLTNIDLYYPSHEIRKDDGPKCNRDPDCD